MRIWPTQDVHFADNKAASADNSSGLGGALYVSPDCSGGFSCKNVSANVTAFSMFGNAAGEVCGARYCVAALHRADSHQDVLQAASIPAGFLRVPRYLLRGTGCCLQAGGALFYDTSSGGAASLVVTSGSISMNTILSGGTGGAYRIFIII